MNNPMDLKTRLEELTALKNEVYETRNMIIKTDNNMRSIFAEIKKLAQKQDEHLAKTRHASLGLYILLVIVLAAGGYFLSNLRADNLQKDIDGLTAEKSQLIGRMSQMELKFETFRSTDVRALKLVEMIKERKREEAIEEFAKLDRQSLQESALVLISEKVEKFKLELAQEYYKTGVAQWKIGGFKRAIQELDKSIKFSESTDFQASLHYYIGHSSYKIKDYNRAVTELLRSLELDPKQDNANSAEYTIGLAYMDQKDWGKCLEFYEKLMERRDMKSHRNLVLANIKKCKQELAKEEARKKKQEEEEAKKKEEEAAAATTPTEDKQIEEKQPENKQPEEVKTEQKTEESD